MEPDSIKTEVSIPSAAVLQAKRQLIDFITENTAPLFGALRSYVQRMGLARHEAVPTVALEVLQEVVVEALDHVDHFDPARQPMAWLLGIALNVIKRKKVEAAKRYQRELSFVSFYLLPPVALDLLGASSAIASMPIVSAQENGRDIAHLGCALLSCSAGTGCLALPKARFIDS